MNKFTIAEDSTKISERSQENFVKENNVYILGPFDRSISSNVIPNLVDLINILQSEKDAFINIYINSPGGYASELFSLLAMIDIAKSKNIKIITYNIGIAYSCGSLLSVVGDYRYMHRYASNLPHLGCTVIASETVEQLNRQINHVNTHFETISSIYQKYTKCTKKDLSNILKDDKYFMNADECLKRGFCDEII